jgi:aryl carrier-like protein
MHFEFEHDAESVFNLLTDPDFLVDRCLALGELEASCEIEEQGEKTVISLTRKLQRDLPAFLARMMDSVQVMHLTEKWQADGEGGWSGDYTFEVEGQPVTIGATFELYPTDDGCCYSIEHRASAKIPLVGRRVEKFILGQAEQGCTAELEYLQNQLDQ